MPRKPGSYNILVSQGDTLELKSSLTAKAGINTPFGFINTGASNPYKKDLLIKYDKKLKDDPETIRILTDDKSTRVFNDTQILEPPTRDETPTKEPFSLLPDKEDNLLMILLIIALVVYFCGCYKKGRI